MYQDNNSTILPNTNEEMLSSKRKNHTNIRYFFITNRIKEYEIEVKYCPTEYMITEYFANPFQGELFIKFFKKILNLRD